MPTAPVIHSQYDPNELLLPYQRNWLEDDSPLKIAEKSRRTGLTWAEAADSVLAASADRTASGTNHFYVGSNKEMAIEFIDACAMWAKSFNKAASAIEEEIFEDEDKDILTFNIRFASGFKVQALSSRPTNLRGRQGNVTIDEAAFHEHLDEVLKAALALTMWGSKIRLISTHNGVENLFNDLIQDSRAGKKEYSVHRVTLDEACGMGLYKRICQIKGTAWSQEREHEWKAGLRKNTASPEDAAEEYDCIPKQGGGTYISRALRESRMHDVSVLRYSGTAEFNLWPEHLREAEMHAWCEVNLKPLLDLLNPNLRHVLGEDFGRSGDLTVLTPMAITQQLKRLVPFMVELHNVPFKQQEQVLFYICDRLPRFSAAKLDARGNGQYLAEQAKYRYGVNVVEEVMLSQSWYLDNMPRFKAAFEDDTILIPRDADVADDIGAIQVIKGVPKLPDGKTDAAKSRHGDAAISLVMAHAASYDLASPIEWIAAPDKIERDNPDNDYSSLMHKGGGW
ncbi:terminase family protein [uncultured Methylophaga sp.]|uniref:terminase large subunit domain-containing protein n=1 Tax=uncultured Methylophaga sp. TaxID=285271 RepID=UPI00260B1153|nr:terminase family protein [uncultured Methylophaga sp.]